MTRRFFQFIFLDAALRLLPGADAIMSHFFLFQAPSRQKLVARRWHHAVVINISPSKTLLYPVVLTLFLPARERCAHIFIILSATLLGKTHCSKSSFFVQKFNFDFPRNIVELFWVKNRENAAVLDFLAVDNFDFPRKSESKKLEKIEKNNTL